VVLHHGRAEGGAGQEEARPSAATACWAALVTGGMWLTLACFVAWSASGRELGGVAQRYSVARIEHRVVRASAK
jgi:hypothetical protein